MVGFFGILFLEGWLGGWKHKRSFLFFWEESSVFFGVWLDSNDQATTTTHNNIDNKRILAARTGWARFRYHLISTQSCYFALVSRQRRDGRGWTSGEGYARLLRWSWVVVGGRGGWVMGLGIVSRGRFGSIATSITQPLFCDMASE